MNPKHYLAVDVGKKAVVLRVKGDGDYFYLIGTSVETSGKCRESATELALVPDPKKSGIVGIYLLHNAGSGKNRTSESTYLTLQVGYKEDRPNIDLEELWIPPDDRTLFMHNVNEADVVIKGERFTTYKYQAEKEGCRFIPDANILFKYVAEDISADDVRKAATEQEVKETAPEIIKKLEERIANLHCAKSAYEEQLNKKDEEIDDLRWKFAMQNKFVHNFFEIMAGPKHERGYRLEALLNIIYEL